MRGLLVLSMIAVVLSFQNCSDAIFSKSSGGGGDPVILTEPPGVVPEFGDILDCNSDFNLSDETIAAVACIDENQANGIYICRIPLDGQGTVDTLCLSAQAAAVEVSNACVCEEEEEPHDGECHNRHHHVWNWFQYLKDKKDSYRTSTYGDDDSDSDSNSSDDDSSSSDDDSSSSDDDSSSSDDDSHDNDQPAVCVPSETVQYRLGNCAELF